MHRTQQVKMWNLSDTRIASSEMPQATIARPVIVFIFANDIRISFIACLFKDEHLITFSVSCCITDKYGVINFFRKLCGVSHGI